MRMRQENISKAVEEELNYLHQRVLSRPNFLRLQNPRQRSEKTATPELGDILNYRVHGQPQ